MCSEWSALCLNASVFHAATRCAALPLFPVRQSGTATPPRLSPHNFLTRKPCCPILSPARPNGRPPFCTQPARPATAPLAQASFLRDLLGDRRWPHTFPGQIPKRTATNRKKARGAKPKALHGGAGHSFRGKAGLCLRGGVRFGGDASGCLGESPRFDRPGRIVNLYGGATVWKTSWAAA